MIQTIYLIMVVMQKRRDGDSFIEYLKESIDHDIIEFMPEGITLLNCELSEDFYSTNIIRRIYGFDTERVFIPYEMLISDNIMELTFSSDNDIKFRELPWLEKYISESIEYYHNLGVIFPYLIKQGEGYTFRLSYKMVTHVSNEGASSKELDEDYSLLTKNANFFKAHFYGEDIPEEYFAGIAKAMLVQYIEEEE
jgi:hypothetical protein